MFSFSLYRKAGQRRAREWSSKRARLSKKACPIETVSCIAVAMPTKNVQCAHAFKKVEAAVTLLYLAISRILFG